MSAYRKLPVYWRAGIARFLGEGSARALRFPRTAAWHRALRAAKLETRPDPDPSGPGVNILGYVRGDSGLAESARLYARALAGAGVPVSLFDVDESPVVARDNHVPVYGLSETLSHETCIVFVNPDRLAAVLNRIGSQRLQGKHLIACWFWELETLPDAWLPATRCVDEFLAPGSFVGNAIRQATDKPLLLAPQPLCPRIDSGLRRADFGLEEGKFVFLAAFDFNSACERKNPLAAVDAFKRAFGPERDDVRLLVKSTNAAGYPDATASLLKEVSGDPRIVVRDDRIEREHLVALQRCCDAMVSLHRAEGFGLVLAEFMSMGKPVVATRWSGNMDYMNEANSCLVDFRLVPVGAGQYPGAEGARWAEPDIDDAVRRMRRLVDEPGFAATIGRQAATDIRRSNGDAYAANRIRERLHEIARNRREMSERGGMA